MPDGSRSAALAGTFADFKLVKTRSVAQLVIELPIEQADAALSILGGVPKPGAEVHVALARLREAPLPAKERAPAADRSFRAKQVYAESDDGTQAVTRAALLCRDTMFQQWAADRSRRPATEEAATVWLRWCAGVKSRSEIATDPKALAAFLKLEREYRDFVQYGEMPR